MEQACTLATIEVIRTGTELSRWSVNASGEPEDCHDSETTEYHDIRYHCPSCGRGFLFWHETEAHMAAQQQN